MNFAVRVSAPLAGLAARLRAAVRAGRRDIGGGAVVARLPATSSLKDPAEIAALWCFEEPEAEPS